MVARFIRRGFGAASGFDFPTPPWLRGQGRAAPPDAPRATPVRPPLEDPTAPAGLRWSSDQPVDPRALERDAFREWEARGGFSMQDEADAMFRAGGYMAPVQRIDPDFVSDLNPDLAAAMLVQRFNAVTNLDQLGKATKVLQSLVQSQTRSAGDAGRAGGRASLGRAVRGKEDSGVAAGETLDIDPQFIDDARHAMVAALRRMNIDFDQLSGEQQKLIRPLLPSENVAEAGATGAARLAPAMKQNILSRTASSRNVLELEQVRADVMKMKTAGQINEFDYKNLMAGIESRHSGLVYDLAGGARSGMARDVRGGLQTSRPMGIELVSGDLTGANRLARYADAIATARTEDELSAIRTLWADEGFGDDVVSFLTRLERSQTYRISTNVEMFANMQREFGWARTSGRTGRAVDAKTGEQLTIDVGGEYAARGVPIAIREIAGIGEVDIAGMPVRMGKGPSTENLEALKRLSESTDIELSLRRGIPGLAGGEPKPTGITDDIIRETPLRQGKEEGKAMYQRMTLRQPLRRYAEGLETDVEEAARLRQRAAEDPRVRYQDAEDDYLEYALHPEYGSIWKIRTEQEFGDWLNRLQAAEDSQRYSESAIMQMREALEDMFIAASRGPLWKTVDTTPVAALGKPVDPVPFGSYSQAEILPMPQTSPGFASRTKALAEESSVTISIGSRTNTNAERAIAEHLEQFDLFYKTDMFRLGHLSGQMDIVIDDIVDHLNTVAARTDGSVIINGTGNALDVLQGSQQQANNYASRILERILNHPGRNFQVAQVVSGGDTGYDIAFAHAARRLGIPVRVQPAVTKTGKPMVHTTRQLKQRPNITKEEWQKMSVRERKEKYGTANYDAFDFDGMKYFKDMDEYIRYMGLATDPFA